MNLPKQVFSLHQLICHPTRLYIIKSNRMNLDETYVCIKEIGRGSYASVHKAISRRTGEICAIKKIPVTSVLNYQDIKNEISIMCECKCENIVRLFGSDCLDGVVWIVMEFCPGGSVKDAMRQLGRTMREEEIIAVLGGVLKALEYIHAKGNVHRDVKAANILLNGDGLAKLGDFGVSEPLEPSESSTRNRKIIGTLLWLSPEVLTGEVSTLVDIWSLGITIIEMGEGQPPYSELDENEALHKIKDLSLPAPTFMDGSKWSPKLIDFLGLCLKKEASERRSAQRLLQHEIVKTSCPSNKVLKSLVAEVGSTSKSSETRLTKRTEYLLKESNILFTTYNNSIMKVIKVDHLFSSLGSIEKEFSNLEASVKHRDAEINKTKTRLEAVRNDITELEREKNDLSATLKNYEARKKDILIQLNQIREHQKVKALENETRKMKLRSLSEKSVQ